MSGKYSVGILATFIIGICIGFAVSDLSHRHHHGRVYAKGRMAATHDRWADHNQNKNSNPAPSVAGNNSQNQDAFSQMEQMRQQIDRDIQRATHRLNLGLATMPNLDKPIDAAGFSSALNVQDRGDHFEVRADLPNTDQKNVKVTSEGDREVRVDVTQQQEQTKNAKGGQSTYSEFGSYDQVVTLPAPADMKDMKIDHQNGELVITIPKAKAS
ncbi:MAG TPA: Hsp20/alpha crystallin family protein [Chthoniobacterales bacterium]|nr:Hsp20/alpha crystallin family protein [Chthoniobacterales bacterium]